MYDALIDALAAVDRPGDFCTAGDLPMTMPGLVVEGLGTIGLPLGETQARELIDRCRQAPYGKGTETLVDTTVRRVWELDARHLEFTNTKWELLIGSLVDELRQQLGLEAHTLSARLYKLLLYEKGSFFLPHRDGERLDGMVATLVVVLPSEHEGGELLVSHTGHQRRISFGGAASGYELSYAAFYADCEHEVKPLERGYRLCLTYNIVLTESRDGKGIAAPSYQGVVDEIEALLIDWRRDPQPQKLAITLDHRYTQTGLAQTALKGTDRPRAEVLFEAAERADCVAHLALVTLWQHGTAEIDYDRYAYGRNRRYHWEMDDAEDEGEDGGDDSGASEYWMSEILETRLSADHWSDRGGHSVQLGRIPLLESEIVADDALDASGPSEEDFEGYTGNEGMTLERWYHRAAVVIWPREEHFAVLTGAGTDAAIGGISALVEALRDAPESARGEQRLECLRFAAAIIDHWKPACSGHFWSGQDNSDRNVFPRVLCELGDPELLGRFLGAVLIADAGIQLDGAFAAFCEQHGWTRFEGELRAVIEASQAATLVRNAGWLQLLCGQRDRNPERLAVCARLCETLVERLLELDNEPEANSWQSRRIDRTALLVSAVAAMLAVDAQVSLSALIGHALNRLEKYPLTETHLAAIFTLQPRLEELTEASEAISRWLATCREALQARTAEPPVEPRDYRREHGLSCSCGDCVQLSRFLADPEKRTLRLSVNKQRRGHLRDVIRDNQCDVTPVTERIGRPYTLVCTKTTASFERARTIYERDVSNLAWLEKLQTTLHV